ncbi:membrane protein [Desulfomarina profundi]|uniref:Membrane protein n=1 Tax=Desulfomarina profundi TaxID=2772557 RepID=A0A8D5FPC3_9BACT|nr:EamA family transporter RarD [Desulfomarina profundi]BCL61919.1 membrane protein [Desulfomarina profundi]
MVSQVRTEKYGGIAAASASYVLWGILPVYWKLLQDVPAYEILCHRMSWSLVVTFLLILLLGRQQSLWQVLKEKRTVLVFTLIASLLAVNWFIYIWAVNSGHIIEASLGYFINPLINVLFGMVFFRERLRPVQWIALGFVCCGVLYLTFYYGHFPWIAIVLAVTFALYGLLHKKVALVPLAGLCLESLVLFVPACVFLFYLEIKGSGSFLSGGLARSFLLFGTGVITAVPLLFFGYAANKIPLSTLGLLQYMAPTINLLLGLFVYNESFPRERIIGFTLIWMALLLYVAENLLNRKRLEKQRIFS